MLFAACPGSSHPAAGQWHFLDPGLGGGDTGVTQEVPLLRVQPRLCSSSLPARFEAIPVTGSVFPCHPWAQQGGLSHSGVTWGWHSRGCVCLGVFTQGAGAFVTCFVCCCSSGVLGPGPLTPEVLLIELLAGINEGHQPKLFPGALGKEVSWRARHSQKGFPSAGKFLQPLPLRR